MTTFFGFNPEHDDGIPLKNFDHRCGSAIGPGNRTLCRDAVGRTARAAVKSGTGGVGVGISPGPDLIQNQDFGEEKFEF